MHSVQYQHLKRFMRGSHETLASSNKETGWLTGLFTGHTNKRQACANSQIEVLPDAELGRTQMQLQLLARVDRELDVSQCNIEAAACIWMKHNE